MEHIVSSSVRYKAGTRGTQATQEFKRFTLMGYLHFQLFASTFQISAYGRFFSSHLLHTQTWLHIFSEKVAAQSRSAHCTDKKLTKKL